MGRRVNKSTITAENIEEYLTRVDKVIVEWPRFLTWVSTKKKKANGRYLVQGILSEKYYKGETVDTDIKEYFRAK